MYSLRQDILKKGESIEVKGLLSRVLRISPMVVSGKTATVQVRFVSLDPASTSTENAELLARYLMALVIDAKILRDHAREEGFKLLRSGADLLLGYESRGRFVLHTRCKFDTATSTGTTTTRVGCTGITFCKMRSQFASDLVASLHFLLKSKPARTDFFISQLRNTSKAVMADEKLNESIARMYSDANRRRRHLFRRYCLDAVGDKWLLTRKTDVASTALSEPGHSSSSAPLVLKPKETQLRTTSRATASAEGATAVAGEHDAIGQQKRSAQTPGQSADDGLPPAKKQPIQVP